MTPRIAAIIPARLASTRFPGKPLLKFHGLPMIEHVRRRVLLSKAFDDVAVATCDQEIAVAVRAFGGRVEMTAANHPGATDRVAEAMGRLDCTHVVNVQGDEILVLPKDLQTMATRMREDAAGEVWNAIAPIAHADDLANRTVVKCMVSQSDRILFCARDFSSIPLKRPYDPARIVLGILGYSRRFLDRFRSSARTPAEIAESIDQNRILEHDHPLQGVPFSAAYPGVNDAQEANLVEKILASDPAQQALLSQLLGMKS